MKLKIADYVTLGNLVSGIFAIYFSLSAMFNYAAFAILVGVFFDYMDGKVARFRKEESEIGVQLDSFSDAITFGVSVAVLLYLRYMDNILSILLVFFVISGVLRLARYNTTSGKEKGQTKYFKGTPITLNGIVFPFLVLLDANIYIILISVLVLSITMISNMKIKHL